MKRVFNGYNGVCALLVVVFPLELLAVVKHDHRYRRAAFHEFLRGILVICIVDKIKNRAVRHRTGKHRIAPVPVGNVRAAMVQDFVDGKARYVLADKVACRLPAAAQAFLELLVVPHDVPLVARDGDRDREFFEIAGIDPLNTRKRAFNDARRIPLKPFEVDINEQDGKDGDSNFDVEYINIPADGVERHSKNNAGKIKK